MRSVIPFKIILDGVSGLIPMTDIHSDLYITKLHRYDSLSRVFEYQDRCFFRQRFLVEPPNAKHFLIPK